MIFCIQANTEMTTMAQNIIQNYHRTTVKLTNKQHFVIRNSHNGSNSVRKLMEMSQGIFPWIVLLLFVIRWLCGFKIGARVGGGGTGHILKCVPEDNGPERYGQVDEWWHIREAIIEVWLNTDIRNDLKPNRQHPASSKVIKQTNRKSS